MLVAGIHAAKHLLFVGERNIVLYHCILFVLCSSFVSLEVMNIDYRCEDMGQDDKVECHHEVGSDPSCIVLVDLMLFPLVLQS